MRREYDSEAIERKWLQRWTDAKLSEPTRGQAGDKKFLLHFAYPGISGYLHVGHMRGFTYSDVFCRFHRMTGHRVLFPAGFHASGIPSVGLARRVERGDPATIEYLKNNGCPPDQIPKLKDAKEVVRYFSQVYAEDYWKRFGFLIDQRTLCSTIDSGYNRFIQWQFRQLQARNLLVQKPHFAPFCALDGAVAVDASETDISKGGNADTLEFTLIKFRLADGTVLPCATLRPETVYGVTNLWLNPAGLYEKVKVGKETWIVSVAAADKMRGQRNDIAPSGEKVDVASLGKLFGRSVKNPVNGSAVPILEAPFVQENRATGVVMSVPAHAPFDWQALHEIRPDIKPLVIVKNPKTSGVPAEEAVKKHGVKSQADKELLEKATEEVYGDEFHGGEMLPNCGPLAGLKCSLAKEKVQEVLKGLDAHATLMDFTEDVVCRCGRPVYVRQIPDQWFIRYSDAALTEESKKHAATMRVFPDDYYRDLPSVLDWFGDRACVRRGSWLGTEFPFKAGWIIEPIADSTFYPAYYIVSPYVNAGKLKPDELTDAFFDYAFLGQGRPQRPVWEEVRKDFDFWYPVDINLGGKEHKTVHFPVYVMNHVALVGPEKRPRGIFVNWWVTQKAGAKISKSKGGAEPIPGAAAKYSVDGMRLYYCNVASPHVDIEWDPDIVTKYRGHVERIYQFVRDVAEEPTGASPPGVDEWLAASWQDRVERARASFERFDLRAATQQVYFEFYNDLQWFRRRGGKQSAVAQAILREWAACLTPVSPFLGEELWAALGGTGLASQAQLPATKPVGPGPAIAQEAYLRQLLEDVGAIARVTKITPKRIIIYTSPPWKQRVAESIRAAVKAGERNVGTLIKQQLAKPDLKAPSKDVSTFVQRAFKDALERAGGDGEVPVFDEFGVLESANSFLSRELHVSHVEVYRADDPDAPDPGNKSAVAVPMKPALFIE